MSTASAHIPRLLTIAGTDPSGGAGQSADMKTFSALGAYATSVVTAVVAQNTCGVHDVLPMPSHMIRAQLAAVFEDVALDGVKIGMVADTDTAQAICEAIEHYRPPFVVLDPVMVAKSGDILVDSDGIKAVREWLIPISDVITPNLPEAAVLLDDTTPDSPEAMSAMLPRLAELGAPNILLKGGHLPGDRCDDLFHDRDGEHRLEARRIPTRALHGAGCTMASAIAALRPHHESWLASVREARQYMTQALEQADRLGVGRGQGPLHHFHAWW
ncbi:bifunctional hydroxymethylpyrimidine kinase/phosphomethylpyrimidine kinase [Kushneria phosphatilytica]|uniref:hydroxymethylpyrimidine kinase n=1 Tax=Kushneria phosphatilytica TaxID=657387 RepID=A0A1S1NME9_9GAMM|nr:bifunctional hydroxymethylpyrimidine kinase/phosphomethylpyrimidine kinase [Kushneria phosphatilytica]OHV08360.1 bifunctional hydroxymethylpyrimidine kinase/phosphomethylpyrimidine kinase [Kushneria phosphatilytica]QEL09779.1 bifunctional hydroxymethylpyrimidine kinase/phosphomethylpyrimidine kinase [Kushneria phosphatilytica]